MTAVGITSGPGGLLGPENLVVLAGFAVLLAFAVLTAFVSSFTVIRARRGQHQESHRRMKIAKAAGLGYAARTAFTKDPVWGGGPFGVGENREARDILYGDRGGVPVVVFEYRWQRTVDDQRQQFARMVAGTPIGGSLPRVEAAREGAVSDLPGDIHTESLVFNKRYRVSAVNRDAAIALLNPRVLDFVVSMGDDAPGFWVENGWLFTSWPVERGVDGDDATLRGLRLTTGLPGLIDRYLAADYGVVGSAGREAYGAAAALLPSLRTASATPVKDPLWAAVAVVAWDLLRSVGRKAWYLRFLLR